VQIVPPEFQSMLQNQREPGCQRGTKLRHRLVDLIAAQVAHLTDLVAIWTQRHVFLQEQDVVYLVLAPHAVARVCVVDAGQVAKVLWLQFLCGNAQFVVETSLSGHTDALCVALLTFLFDFVKRMAAARVGVGVWEGYLRIQRIMDLVIRGLPFNFTL